MRLPVPVLSLGAAALVGGGAGAAVATATGGHDTTTITRTITQPAATAGARTVAATTPNALTARQVYDKAKNSVAYITAQVTGTATGPFGGTSTGTSTGSGFVVSGDGYVVTNAHVVEGARSVKVKIGDGTAMSARIVGRDTSSDLALLKVDPQGRTLAPLKLADSSKVAVGDPTYAIGNPFGLSRTLTTGVISALQRQISAPNGYSIDDVLQSDAALNPGNSGGPLLDAAGRVIGVNSAIRTSGGQGDTGSIGIGFAVPIDTVKRIVPQLRRSGRVARPYIGVTSVTVTSALRQLGLEVERGALVQQVEPGSPAERAGIRGGDVEALVGDQALVLGGDVIVEVDGDAIAKSDDIARAVEDRKPGEVVEVRVLRGDEERTVKVRLARRPAEVATG